MFFVCHSVGQLQQCIITCYIPSNGIRCYSPLQQSGILYWMVKVFRSSFSLYKWWFSKNSPCLSIYVGGWVEMLQDNRLSWCSLLYENKCISKIALHIVQIWFTMMLWKIVQHFGKHVFYHSESGMTKLIYESYLSLNSIKIQLETGCG